MGGGKATQTSTVEPFSGEYKPWVYPVKDQVYGRLQNPSPSYPGQLSYPTTANQQYAFNQYRQAAESPVLKDTIAGKYLNPETNPYLQQTYDAAARNVRKDANKMFDNINAQFSRGGLYNSSARYNSLRQQADLANNQYANLGAQIFGGNYNQERGYQLQGLAAQQQMLGNVLNAGNVEQQIGQNSLDRDYRDWLRRMGVDDANLDRAINFMQTMKSPRETQTQTKGK